MAFVTPLSIAPRARIATASSVSSFRGVRPVFAAQPRAAVVMNLETIKTKIADELKKAEAATAKFGKDSKEAALAWDVVEELEAEASHIKAKGKPDPLDEFCKDSPEADECRVYED